MQHVIADTRESQYVVVDTRASMLQWILDKFDYKMR